MDAPAAPAAEHDLHDLSGALPHVELVHGPSGNPIYQVGRKSFVYFRTPPPRRVRPGDRRALRRRGDPARGG